MRKIVVSLLMLIAATTAMAQQYVPNTHWPYVYENFQPGTIFFSDNTKSSADLNIHLWGNVLHYVNKDGKIYQSDDKNVVRVEIGNDAYMYGDHKMMQIVDAKGNAVLVKLAKADFDSMFAGTGAYGGSLNSSASKDLSSLDLGGMNQPELGKMLEAKKDGREINCSYPYYFIIGGKLVEATNKGVASALDADKTKQFESFVKSNKIKWRKEDSLKTVLNFFAK